MTNSSSVDAQMNDEGNTSRDLSPREFHDFAMQAVEWMERYLEGNATLPVLPRVAPGDLAAQLPMSAPERGEPFATLMQDFEQLIVPGITHWNHPGFMAYFANTASMPGIVAEMLIAALNNNAMLWKTGPAATELELRVVDWLREAMGLPAGWFGFINDTASISTMLSLAAARESLDLGIRERGMAGRADLPVLRVYTSAHSHSSVDKSAITLGIGQQNVVHIEVDDNFRMRADKLEEAIRIDRAAGLRPLAIVATLGTTSTSSVDPVSDIAAICEREKVWLHVDASYAGPAALIPEHRHHFTGWERADSIVVNPHKWLFVPVDCSTLFVRDPDTLKRAFALVPEYLTTREQSYAVNLMDYGVQLGRRFRSLKLWFVMRAFGLQGLRQRLQYQMDIAAEFAQWIAAAEDWTLMAPAPFSLVCFRYAPPGVNDEDADALNERILADVNAEGSVYLSHTKLNDRYTIRLAIGNLRTELKHVSVTWEQLQRAAQAEASGPR